ncbi:hypothetical protein BRADI_5g00619v3 [Brachypodium distachyon]|uniref:Uncharacterized protein n=1 Tax=Brachypodium distachyon TaxID=15368 RepID=A0A2K2CEM8_BRADI|nr:hypothetical protein BRADI_5g00619v3 [Brachypodium distachyon]PNT60487.1 hypothetical protein BRADI_5g00619v3 [Brachypodium distachyon]
MRLGQLRPHRGVSATRSFWIRLAEFRMVIQPSSSSSSLKRWEHCHRHLLAPTGDFPAAMSTTVSWLRRGSDVQRQHRASLTTRHRQVQEEDNDVYLQELECNFILF